MFDVFLPEKACLLSDESKGELLWPLEVFWTAPGLTSLMRGGGRSEPVPVMTASRLLETAARRPDPLDLTKLELDNIASLARGESIATGLFCLAKIPECATGPDCLLRAGSVEDQPVGLPSPPVCKAPEGGTPELGPAPSAREGGGATCDC